MRKGWLLLLMSASLSLVAQQGGTGIIRIKKLTDEDSAGGVISLGDRQQGVKCRIAWELSDRFGLSRKKTERVLYDEQGLVTEIFHKDGSYKTMFGYDSVQRLVSQWMVSLSDGIPLWMEETSYPYDGVARTVRITTSFRDTLKVSDTAFVITRVFDGKGKLLEERTVSGKRLERSLCFYDSLGRMQKEIVFVPGQNDSVSLTREHFYDSAGVHRIVISRWFKKNNKVNRKTMTRVYRYDEKGRLLQEQSYGPDVHPSNTVFFYNEQGRLSEQKTWVTGTNGTSYEHLVYEYILY